MTTKKLLLITTSFELFYQLGINSVGINKILETSGIAKKTLYTHFQSKEELIEAALIYRDLQFKNWLFSRVDESPMGIERIHALFDSLDDWFNNRVAGFQLFRGCFFINAIAEFGDSSSRINQLCVQHKIDIRNFIETKINEISINAANIELVIDSVQILKEGAITTATMTNDLNAAKKAKEAALMIINAYIEN